MIVSSEVVNKCVCVLIVIVKIMSELRQKIAWRDAKEHLMLCASYAGENILAAVIGGHFKAGQFGVDNVS